MLNVALHSKISKKTPELIVNCNSLFYLKIDIILDEDPGAMSEAETSTTR